LHHLFHVLERFRSLNLLRAFIVPTALTVIISTGCGSSNWTAAEQKTPPTVAHVLASGTTLPPVLLFNGSGTSASDVTAVENILNSLSLKFATANSSQLNSMSLTHLKSFKLFIVPGGNSITIGKYLTHTATANVHNAVINGGLHYLGICAGGFFGGYSIHNGLNLTSGVWFNYFADYFKGINKAAVLVTASNGSKLDQYWQQGPQFHGWGTIVGKYPDGTPDVVEGKSGYGWVILSGVHPEATAGWRYGMTFTTSVTADNDYARTLVMAALNGTSLAHF